MTADQKIGGGYVSVEKISITFYKQTRSRVLSCCSEWSRSLAGRETVSYTAYRPRCSYSLCCGYRCDSARPSLRTLIGQPSRRFLAFQPYPPLPLPILTGRTQGQAQAEVRVADRWGNEVAERQPVVAIARSRFTYRCFT